MKSKYGNDLRAQVIKESKETGNAAMVARRHEVPIATVYSWLRSADKPKNLTKAEVIDLRKKLEEKELENAILKDLLKKTNQAWLKE